MKRSEFDGIVAHLRTSGMNNREKMQAVLLAAMEHFKTHNGDPNWLNKVMDMCRETKCYPTKAIHSYIIDHVECRWKKNTSSYAKTGEGKVKTPAMPWYDYKNSQDVGMYDYLKARKTALSNAIKAYRKGALKDNADGKQKSIIEHEAKLVGLDLPDGWDKAKNEENKGEEAAA